MHGLLLRLLNRQLLFSFEVKSEIISNIVYQSSRFSIWKSFNQRKNSDSNFELKAVRFAQNNVQKCYITSMSKSADDLTFQGIPDRYKGLTVNSAQETCDSETFTKKLNESLKQWIANGVVRTIWFKIDIGHSDWVPILAKNGFSLHHAQTEYVMMYRWLPTHEESNIPRFAHTMIGVGSVVVNDNEEVLVVREKYFPKGFPHWKLPGGYVETGEDIDEAAVREVLEETGIETKFDFVVSFRHTHGVNFDCSDIYFIVGLTPLTQEIKKCDREIMACEWMKINEYMEHPHVHETNRFFLQKYLEYKTTGKVIDSHKAMHPLLKRPYTVFKIDDLKKKENATNDEVSEKSKI